MLQLTAIGEVIRVQKVREVNGSKVLNATIKTTRKYKDREFNSYIDAAFWGQKAQVQLYEGQPIAVIGEPKVGVYENKEGKWKGKQELRVLHCVSGISEPESDVPQWAQDGEDLPL